MPCCGLAIGLGNGGPPELEFPGVVLEAEM